MNTSKNKNIILLLDPETQWGNKYETLIEKLEMAGFEVHVFGIIRFRDNNQYEELINECVEFLDLCDILLKPQDDIVDYWLSDLFSKRNFGIKKIINHAKTTNKIILTFKADWNDFDPPSFSNIYFDDNADRIVRELKERIDTVA